MSQRGLANEQAHHIRAFEYYHSLGDARTYAAVAAAFSVTEGTVKLWGKSFSWQKRLQQRELEVAREMASRTLSDEVNHREQHLKIVRMAMVKLAKAIADGEVKMSIGDLDKMIRLEAFLRDRTESRSEVAINFDGASPAQLKEMILEELKVLKNLGTEMV